MVQNILWIGYNLNLHDFKSPKPNTLLLYASFRVFCAHCYFFAFLCVEVLGLDSCFYYKRMGFQIFSCYVLYV